MDKNLEILKHHWLWSNRRIAREIGASNVAVSNWLKDENVSRETWRPRDKWVKALALVVERERYLKLPKILPYAEMKKMYPHKMALDYLLENSVSILEIAQYSFLPLKTIQRCIRHRSQYLEASEEVHFRLRAGVNRMAKIRSEEKVIDLLDSYDTTSYDQTNEIDQSVILNQSDIALTHPVFG
jgi:hypothetical protein